MIWVRFKPKKKINVDKLGVFFNPNSSKEEVREIKLLWGVNDFVQYEKYLGLPSIVGRNKKQIFHSIYDRVVNKIKGWKEKLLSRENCIKIHLCA